MYDLARFPNTYFDACFVQYLVDKGLFGRKIFFVIFLSISLITMVGLPINQGRTAWQPSR
jgi:hypothetical protein